MLPLTRSRNRARFFGIPFSPSVLFAGGTVPGAWYDPSDLTTLFTTSAGTTPVSMPGQGTPVSVGLMLDKSQGLVLGPELLADSNFDNAASWETNGVTITGGEAVWNTAASAIYVRQPNITVANTYYEFTIVCSSYTSGTLFVGIGPGASNLTSHPVNAVGTVRFRLNVGANSGRVWLITPTGGAQLSITSFSVRQVSGNHAIAINDTTARPELRARVNLLTYSEDWSVSPWANVTGGTASAPTLTTNAGIAPDGTTTATRIQFALNGGTTTSDNTRRRQVTTTPAGTNTFSFYVRSFDGVSTYRMQYEDANGFISGIDVTGSWQRVTATAIYAAGNTGLGFGLRGGQTPANSDTADVLVWGADLRPANIGANVPAYQRIADANTYDTAGFPLYLRFDGIDDGMYTPANLNLSATDKVGVFAGVRKLSDAATGVLTEISNGGISNPQAFSMWAPFTTTVEYAAQSRGNAGSASGQRVQIDNAAFVAPVSNTFTGIFDISGDISSARLNGVLQGTATADQGAGNFGNYPLNIGVRSAASSPTLYFNGHLYSLAVVGSAVSAGNIAAMENWVAGKTGIVIP